MIAKDVNWVVPLDRGQTPHAQEGSGPYPVMSTVRYNSKTSLATVELLNDNSVKVKFDKPVLSITPGQACVFYDSSDQVLLGGGWILS